MCFCSDRWQALEGGELAQAISNASFMCLMLIYTLSQLLDTATLVATAAGALQRVAGLVQVCSHDVYVLFACTVP